MFDCINARSKDTQIEQCLRDALAWIEKCNVVNEKFQTVLKILFIV